MSVIEGQPPPREPDKNIEYKLVEKAVGTITEFFIESFNQNGVAVSDTQGHKQTKAQTDTSPSL